MSVAERSTVDLPGLRELAASDVKPLAERIAECERTAGPFWRHC